MRLPATTTRRTMLAIATFAALFWPGMMWRRAKAFRKKAATYAAMERAMVAGIPKAEQEQARYQRGLQMAQLEGDAASVDFCTQEVAFWSGHITWQKELMEYGSTMKQKYERAAWRPWQLVAPDPLSLPLEYPNERHAPTILKWWPDDPNCPISTTSDI